LPLSLVPVRKVTSFSAVKFCDCKNKGKIKKEKKLNHEERTSDHRGALTSVKGNVDNMSFTTSSTTFSTNYPSLGSVPTPSQRVQPASSLASVYAASGVAPWGLLADIRAQNVELAQKNREELGKYWSQQIEESTTVRDAETTLTDLRRTLQALEIDLDAMKNQNISLENSLRDMEA
ncbi:hypothetical protein U0070_006482, partial [Myodes glareolus]